MPRRGGGGGRAAPRPRSPPPQPSRSYSSHPPPPAPHAAPPPPAQRSGGMFSGLGGMVAQGMALGTGSAMAHEAVHRLFSSGKNPEPAEAAQAATQIAQSPQEPCSAQAKTFMDCMEARDGDMGSCQFYFDSLKSCKLDNDKGF